MLVKYLFGETLFVVKRICRDETYEQLRSAVILDSQASILPSSL